MNRNLRQVKSRVRVFSMLCATWIPAFAGMTIFAELSNDELKKERFQYVNKSSLEWKIHILKNSNFLKK